MCMSDTGARLISMNSRIMLMLAATIWTLGFATTAQAQVIAADSQAIAVVIARSLSPEIEKKLGPDGRVALEARQMFGPGIDTTAMDSTSTWFKLIRAQVRTLLPNVVADSVTQLMLLLRLSTVQLSDTQVVLRGLFTRCDPRPGPMARWVHTFVLTLDRVNSQWQPGKPQFSGVADTSC